eukprot:7992056-Pyramimonas_sp.AAC.1
MCSASVVSALAAPQCTTMGGGSTARSGLPETSKCAAISCCIGGLTRPVLRGLPIGTECVILLAAL